MFQRLDGLHTIEFGTPGPSREKLVNLILDGQKRATAALLIRDYEDEGEPIEHVGDNSTSNTHLSKTSHKSSLFEENLEILRFCGRQSSVGISPL